MNAVAIDSLGSASYLEVDRLEASLTAAESRGGKVWLSMAGSIHRSLTSWAGITVLLEGAPLGGAVHLLVEKPGRGISHFHAQITARPGGVRHLTFSDESQRQLDQSVGVLDVGPALLDPLTDTELGVLEELAMNFESAGLTGSDLLHAVVAEARSVKTPRWRPLGVVSAALIHALRSDQTNGDDSTSALELVDRAGWAALHADLAELLDDGPSQANRSTG